MLYVVGYSTIDVRESLLEVILRGLILIETGDVLRFDEAIPCQEKKVEDEFPISLALFPSILQFQCLRWDRDVRCR